MTYLEVKPNTVIRIKTKEKDGYDAVVLGMGPKTWRTRKGREHTRFSVQKEWRVPSLEGLEPGKPLSLEGVSQGSLVTITGIGKGKGFQGVMKRHHFGGGPATHGSHFKREPGSIGMREYPGRVLKGHLMGGRMGGETVTVKHRHILFCDPQKGVLGVKGPVPGPIGSHAFVTLESSTKL